MIGSPYILYHNIVKKLRRFSYTNLRDTEAKGLLHVFIYTYIYTCKRYYAIIINLLNWDESYVK